MRTINSLPGQRVPYSLVFDVDYRSSFWKKIEDFDKFAVLAHFPLTKHKYVFYGRGEGLQDGELRKLVWDKLSEDEKKMYREAGPDEEVQRGTDELMKFNTPEVGDVSEHFGLLEIVPDLGRCLY